MGRVRPVAVLHVSYNEDTSFKGQSLFKAHLKERAPTMRSRQDGVHFLSHLVEGRVALFPRCSND